MRILHAGWGFQPFRKGGLIEYAEDLMETQVQNGYDVFYFCTGRGDILSRRPYVDRWQSAKGYPVFELRNPPIISGLEYGVREPLFDTCEKVTEREFLKVVDSVRPDIVHFQEFLGIPTSVVPALSARGIKVVFTAEDYFVLCPVLKLVNADGHLCYVKDGRLGAECARCCSRAPANNFLHRFQTMLSIQDKALWWQVKKVGRQVLERLDITLEAVRPPDGKLAGDFNERRRRNLTNLQHADMIIAMSGRVAEIFRDHAPFTNLKVLQLTIKHLGSITPYVINVKAPIRLAMINVMGSDLKGRKLMFDVFGKVASGRLSRQVHFVVLGNADADSRALMNRYPFVEYAGNYSPLHLDRILEELKITVGIMPSLWEEAYGYAGVEFLAKGIPVIGNRIGGIPDYVIDGETGWTNESCSADELFAIIDRLCMRPDDIVRINRNLITNRSRYIKTMEGHFHEMDHIYHQLLRPGNTN